jgi:hypothetical protein
VGRVGLDEGRLADRHVLDERAEASHMILVQKVFVQRHQVQLVEKLEVRSRYSRHVRNGLKLYFFILSLV